MSNIKNSHGRAQKLVCKANDLVEAKYRLTVQEQKIIIMAISKINPLATEFDNPYSLSINEVAEACDINRGGTYQKVAAAVDRLMTRLVKLKTDDGHIVTHWIQRAKYYTGQGHFDFWFDGEMKPYLLQLKEYISYDRNAVLQFQSQYSFRIYEILKKWQGANKPSKFSVKVDQLRDVLGVRKTEYKLFGDFNRYVIKKAQTELTQQSDLTFESKTWKEGRAVVGIIFTIKDNVPTGKAIKKKRGRPRKNKSDQEIHLEKGAPIDDFLNGPYSNELSESLHSKGVVHHDKYAQEGIKEEHWEKALSELGAEANPGLIVSCAKKHRDLNHSSTPIKKPDFSASNRLYWESNKNLYQGLMESEAYLQSASGKVITWSDSDFINKLAHYLRVTQDENKDKIDQRETNLFIETFKLFHSGGAQQKIINLINQNKDSGIYTHWSTEEMRHKGTNPERIGAFMVGRASKENENILREIFDTVYGEDWEIRTSKKLGLPELE